jgi:hypothetical protein
MKKEKSTTDSHGAARILFDEPAHTFEKESSLATVENPCQSVVNFFRPYLSTRLLAIEANPGSGSVRVSEFTRSNLREAKARMFIGLCDTTEVVP